jgi:N-acetyl-anhydromuramyl-L-alanine amidase AmpD
MPAIVYEERLSPNRRTRPAKVRESLPDPKRPGKRITKDRAIEVNTLVLHADAAANISSSIAWMLDDESDVSYHVAIGRTGHVYLIVPFDNVAYACGVSEFPYATVYPAVANKAGEYRPSINLTSISLCFGNKNVADDGELYTDAQYEVGAKVAADIMRKFPRITLARITTHAAVAKPDGRKTDPIEFDLERFKGLVRMELTNAA